MLRSMKYMLQKSRSYHSTAAASMAHILATDQIDELCIQIFEERGHRVDVSPSLSEGDLCKIIGRYDGLVVRSATKVTPAVLKSGTNLRLIGRAGVGVDNININDATKRGIMVMNTPDGNTMSTAQLTLSLLFNLARKLPAANSSVKRSEWDRKSFTGTELFGKTLGIIGCGRIGENVARGAAALGLRVVGYDQVMTVGPTGIKMVSLDQIWEQSDFITLHTPLTETTKNLINAETISKCKAGVYLVNCARGGIIDELALLDALKSGKVAGAALDVYTSEPPGEKLSELIAHPNLICTPHLGASTEEAQVTVAKDVAYQMCDVFDQKAYFGVLNVSYMESASQPAMKPFMKLAEIIGAIQGQIAGADTKVLSVEIKTSGGREIDISTDKARGLLQAKMLQGLLKHQGGDIVPDLISAPLIAKEANIFASISSDLPDIGGNYNNMIYVSVKKSNGSEMTIAGVVFGNAPHIVHVDDQRNLTAPFTFKPEGNYLLMFENQNQPGILKDVLNILTMSNVNVGSMSVAPISGKTHNAFSFIVMDDDIPTNAMNALNALSSLTQIHKIKLH